MTTISGVVSKTEGLFERFVIPLVAVAGGWLGGPVVLSPLVGLVDRVDVAGTGKSAFADAFGPGIDGSGLVAGIVAVIAGFSLFKMGGLIRAAGLFFIAAGARVIANSTALIKSVTA